MCAAGPEGPRDPYIQLGQPIDQTLGGAPISPRHLNCPHLAVLINDKYNSCFSSSPACNTHGTPSDRCRGTQEVEGGHLYPFLFVTPPPSPPQHLSLRLSFPRTLLKIVNKIQPNEQRDKAKILTRFQLARHTVHFRKSSQKITLLTPFYQNIDNSVGTHNIKSFLCPDRLEAGGNCCGFPDEYYIEKGTGDNATDTYGTYRYLLKVRRRVEIYTHVNSLNQTKK